MQNGQRKYSATYLWHKGNSLSCYNFWISFVMNWLFSKLVKKQKSKKTKKTSVTNTVGASAGNLENTSVLNSRGEFPPNRTDFLTSFDNSRSCLSSTGISSISSALDYEHPVSLTEPQNDSSHIISQPHFNCLADVIPYTSTIASLPTSTSTSIPNNPISGLIEELLADDGQDIYPRFANSNDYSSPSRPNQSQETIDSSSQEQSETPPPLFSNDPLPRYQEEDPNPVNKYEYPLAVFDPDVLEDLVDDIFFECSTV